MTPISSDREVRTLSVVIPCRNGAGTLRRLIDGLRSLALPPGWNMEILVGYQDSTDDTLSLLRTLPVEVVHSLDRGPAAARNDAAAAAAGDWIWFIDADAWPSDESLLLRLAGHLEGLENPGVVGGPILLPLAQARNPIAVADHFACWFNWLPSRSSGPTKLFHPAASIAMPRPVFEAVGGFDRRYRVMEDFELQERINAAGYTLYHLQDFGIYHQARATLRSSWAHSRYWGRPFKETYYDRIGSRIRWLYYSDRWFWINLPAIFLMRMARVVAMSWKDSPRLTLYSFPFLLATVLAWAVGVASGRRQPRDD